MMELLIIGLWFVGGLLFCLWDSFIGLGCELDGSENPPLLFAAACWPIAVPVLLFHNFCRLCEHIKDSRKEKQRKTERAQAQKEKLRIAAEREFEANMAQVEAEMAYSDATKNKNSR